METARQPFQNIVDTSLFYGGGARREIVDDIVAALADEVQLLTLTGTDGSGKTMICRMVELELQGSAEAEVLYFERGAESFDEVVDRIAAQVELEESDDIKDRNTRLEKAVEILHEQNRRLVIILDGAEKIFLATLERIRRMIDQVNEGQLSVQVLLSGRPLFSLNFKQLAIINFNIVKEKHFSLDPLDGKATHLYLNHCLDQSDTQEQKRFSLGQAEEIADIARGNFKLINQLAGKVLDLKRLASEKGAIDEDDYDEEDDLPGASSRLPTGLANVDLDFLKVPKIAPRWYAVGAGIVALVLIIALFRGGEEDQAETVPVIEDVPELTLEKVEPDPIDIPQPSRTAQPLPPPAPAVSVKEPEPQVAEAPQPEPAAEGREETVVPTSPEQSQPVAVETPPPEPAAESVQEAQVSEVLEKPAAEPETAVEPAPRAAAETVVQTPPAQPAVAQTDEQTAAELPQLEENREQTVAEEPPAAPVPASVETTAEAAVNDQAEAADAPQRETIATQNTDDASLEAVEPDSGETQNVPKLTVLPRKRTPAETPPATVVTLTGESKRKPGQPDDSSSDSSSTESQAVQDEVEETPVRAEVVVEEEPAAEAPQPDQVASLEQSAAETTPPPPATTRTFVQPKDSSVYYAQRLAAGSRWLVGSSKEKYTVQLMVLSSEDAQQNVRYMLSEEDYHPIMDQLFILRKVGQPQTVMLYWGEFDTPAEARAARNQLPTFLSRLEPFEIPVKDAVAKARAGQ